MTPTLSARCGSGRLWLRVLGMFAALAALTSCGGDPAPGPSTGTPRASTLSVAMTNGSGAPTFMVSRDAPLTVTATLANGNGQPIVNSLVQLALNFAESGSPAVLTTSSGVTDSNGRFSTTLLAASTSAQGGGTLTATAPNVTEAPSTVASFQVVATTPVPVGAALALALTDPLTGATRATMNRNSPLLATATLTDGSGKPIPNTLVQYTLSFLAGTSVAVMAPTSGSGVTDTFGRFPVQLIANSTTTAGTGTLTATAVGVPSVSPVMSAFQVTATNPPALAPIVNLTLTDPQTGANRNTLTLASPLNATATVLDAAGRPVVNSLIQFSLSTAGGGAPVAVFSPASGTGITDANGRFNISLQAAGLTTQGAGTLRATAINETNAPSGTVTYQVGATPIALGNITRSPVEIEPLQTSTITVQVSGVPGTVPVNVRFTSLCAANGQATLPASVVTANGIATAVYTDKGCAGTDTITISADGASSVQTTLVVLQPPPIAIQFIDATPTDMSIFGVGGQPTSVVVFRVVNVAQQPVSDVPVTLTLATDVFGVTLDGQGPTVTKRSGADGTVRVTVVAGTQAGPVRVIATANDGALRAISSLLSIHTSLPVQDRFSLSRVTSNPECFNFDGTQNTFIIRVGDRIGNPVPDGTAINFRTTAGIISPVCRTVGGVCQLTWTSQEPRPPSGLGVVLAWAVGEEDFFDTNGNNRYDPGEPFADLGNAFVDNNLNGVWDSGSEEFIAYNPLNSGACVPTPPVLQPAAPAVPNTCDGVWGLAHVRDSASFSCSGSTANLSGVPFSVQLGLSEDSCVGGFSFVLADPRGNPMPAGTTVTATVEGGTATVFGSPVPNTLSATSVSIQVRTAAGTVPGSDPPVRTCSGLGQRPLNIDVVTPAGFRTTRTVTVN